MEIEVLGVDGAPEGAVVSVRAGSQRKQAAVAALGPGRTPFRFATGGAGLNPFKIDLLQPSGSLRLALKPVEGTYCTDFKGTAKGVRVKFAVREAGKKGELPPMMPTPQVLGSKETEKPLDKPMLDAFLPVQRGDQRLSPSERNGAARLPPLTKDEEHSHFTGAATAAKDYLEVHQLLPFVRSMLQTVLRERPADPYSFIADQFRNASAAAIALKVSEPIKPSKLAKEDPWEPAAPAAPRVPGKSVEAEERAEGSVEPGAEQSPRVVDLQAISREQQQAAAPVAARDRADSPAPRDIRELRSQVRELLVEATGQGHLLQVLPPTGELLQATAPEVTRVPADAAEAAGRAGSEVSPASNSRSQLLCQLPSAGSWLQPLPPRSLSMPPPRVRSTAVPSLSLFRAIEVTASAADGGAMPTPLRKVDLGASLDAAAKHGDFPRERIDAIDTDMAKWLPNPTPSRMPQEPLRPPVVEWSVDSGQEHPPAENAGLKSLRLEFPFSAAAQHEDIFPDSAYPQSPVEYQKASLLSEDSHADGSEEVEPVTVIKQKVSPSLSSAVASDAKAKEVEEATRATHIDTRASVEDELGSIKQKARDAFGIALLSEAAQGAPSDNFSSVVRQQSCDPSGAEHHANTAEEEPPDDAGSTEEEEHAAKEKAGSVLSAALLDQAHGNVPVDYELEAAKQKARLALGEAVSAELDVSTLANVDTSPEQANARGFSLAAAEDTDEDDDEEDEYALHDEKLEAAKLKARSALGAALAAEQPGGLAEAGDIDGAELEVVKARARNALEAAALAKQSGCPAVEDLKNEPEADDAALNAAKLNAQEALDAVLRANETQCTPAEDENNGAHDSELEAARLKARAALGTALLAQRMQIAGDGEQQAAKANNQQARNEDENTDEDEDGDSEESTDNEQLEEAKLKAREVLGAALLSEHSHRWPIVDEELGDEGDDEKDEDEEGHSLDDEQLETAKLKARNALGAALLANPPGNASAEEVDTAEAKVPGDLTAADVDVGEDGDGVDNELEEARSKAAAALGVLLCDRLADTTSNTGEQAEVTKPMAPLVPSKAVEKNIENQTPMDFEEAKLKACVPQGAQPDHHIDAMKADVQNAVDAGTLAKTEPVDLSSDSEIDNDDGELDHTLLEAVKQKARLALGASLLSRPADSITAGESLQGWLKDAAGFEEEEMMPESCPKAEAGVPSVDEKEQGEEAKAVAALPEEVASEAAQNVEFEALAASVEATQLVSQGIVPEDCLKARAEEPSADRAEQRVETKVVAALPEEVASEVAEKMEAEAPAVSTEAADFISPENVPEDCPKAAAEEPSADEDKQGVEAKALVAPPEEVASEAAHEVVFGDEAVRGSASKAAGNVAAAFQEPSDTPENKEVALVEARLACAEESTPDTAVDGGPHEEAISQLRSSLEGEMERQEHALASVGGAEHGADEHDDDPHAEVEKPQDGELSFPDSLKPSVAEEATVQAVQQKLGQTKASLSELNANLKDEVTELGKTLELLVQERDALRARHASSST